MAAEQKETFFTSWGWGRTEPPVLDRPSWSSFPWYTLAGVTVLLGFTPFWCCPGLLSLAVSVVLTVVALPFVLSGFVVVHAIFEDYQAGAPEGGYEVAKYLDFKDPALATDKPIPVEALYEHYFAGRIDVRGDLLDALYRREKFARMVYGVEHVRFFLLQFLPELLIHSKKQDETQVRDHYDRGNDFYNSFLGETMIYTSAIFHDKEETLEQAQINKMNLVMNKAHTKKGMRHLDIGCGWGTLCVHAAKEFGTTSTGVTLAREQTAWAREQIKKAGVEKGKSKAGTAEILCMDYRQIPKEDLSNGGGYDVITCLEMAEHVGVRLFNSFLCQVRDMLKDDGIFYLQIAGLRRAWQHEDLLWGLFMGKYVFPGADASCPLGWVVTQCEQAGFEVHTVETVGVHYSATIKRWYDNWVKNKAPMEEKYGVSLYRKWLWFLGWSVVCAENGFSTAYQLVLHKNTSSFDRKRYIAERKQWKI